MEKHLPEWRDRQRERERVRLQHELHVERSNGYKLPRSWKRRALLGVVLGSMGYLITSCFLEARLHKPKVDRREFRFDHRPQEVQP